MALKDVMAGVQQRTFAGLETTLHSYRRVYWHPRLFNRQFFAAWQGEGARTIRQKTQVMIRELLSQYEYELEGKLRSELDKILAKAKSEL
ncbi:TPA: hypothetical protein EYP66_05415 [Candidatus Poribacteria bacterium]|nr:hypothetical protein [Candidatus Poribacteria bacterium]